MNSKYDLAMFDRFVDMKLCGRPSDIDTYVKEQRLPPGQSHELKKDLMTACAIIEWQDELTASYARELAEEERAAAQAAEAKVSLETSPLTVRGLFPQISDELNAEFANWAENLPDTPPPDAAETEAEEPPARSEGD